MCLVMKRLSWITSAVNPRASCSSRLRGLAAFLAAFLAAASVEVFWASVGQGWDEIKALKR